MTDRVIRLSATFAAFAGAAAELREALEARGIGSKTRYNTELVFEEIVSNIIRHGCPDLACCSIEVRVRFEENAISMRFQDDGPPFDPRSYDLPELPRSLEDARNGGLGLLLVNKASQRIEYEWTMRRNNVTVTIPLAEAVSAAAS